jgi:glutamyl/glutaminyl-tRNA synthetase
MAQHFNFNSWIDYFILNKRDLMTISWTEIYKLTKEEFETIFDSIRIFQKGESSEAKHIFKTAKQFLNNQPDQSYMDALTLFINEEHRHAFELKRFMSLQDIPCLKKHWSDTVFRQLRRFGGLEQSISVLLTAEFIAAVYYKALKHSTHSIVLNQICEQILSDEEMHIRFQSEAISQFYADRSRYFNKLITIAKRILLEGTLLVVWQGHEKVFSASGYDFFKLRKECLSEFYKSMHIIKSKLSGINYKSEKLILQTVPLKEKNIN